MFARKADDDVLVLAENGTPVSELVKSLNTGAERVFFPDPLDTGNVTTLTRFPVDKRCLIRDTARISIREYKTPLSDSFLVVAVHLPSKLWKMTEDQAMSCARLARLVQEAEEKVGHQRTIVIGDFNMNPFETGLVASEGLHAIADRRIVAKRTRRVQEEDCTFFYNPMWSHFGALDSSPPGTYFSDSGGEVILFWNIFAQVMIRPDFLPYFSDESVSLVTEISGEPLLDNNGHPNKELHSDHLPIVCRLSEIVQGINVNS